MPRNDASLETIGSALKGATSVRVFYHKKPDGDAIGSAHALALGLKSLGIGCETACCDPLPRGYEDLVEGASGKVADGALQVAVDCAGPSRMGSFQDERIDIVLDHHGNNAFPESCMKHVEPESSSCCEIILSLLQTMGVAITPRIADLLFTGLVTDTFCFRTASTTGNSFEAAALLAGMGASTVELARRFCLQKSHERIQVEESLMRSMRYACEGKLIGGFIGYEDMVRVGIKDSDLEGINALVEQVEGMRMGVVVREGAPGMCRVSVRSVGNLDASAVCAEFGGGGHFHAAGCELESNPEEALARVMAACSRMIEGFHGQL